MFPSYHPFGRSLGGWSCDYVIAVVDQAKFDSLPGRAASKSGYGPGFVSPKVEKSFTLQFREACSIPESQEIVVELCAPQAECIHLQRWTPCVMRVVIQTC